MKYKPNKPDDTPEFTAPTSKAIAAVLIICLLALTLAATTKLIMKMFGWDL